MFLGARGATFAASSSSSSSSSQRQAATLAGRSRGRRRFGMAGRHSSSSSGGGGGGDLEYDDDLDFQHLDATQSTTGSVCWSLHHPNMDTTTTRRTSVSTTRTTPALSATLPHVSPIYSSGACRSRGNGKSIVIHPYCEELDGPMYPTDSRGSSPGSSPSRNSKVHWASAGRDPTEDVPTSPQRRSTRVSEEEDSPENDDHNNDGEPTSTSTPSTTTTNENTVIVDDLDLFLAEQRSLSPQTTTNPPTGMEALLDRPMSGVIRTASAVSSTSNATRSSSIASSGEASTDSAKKRRRNRHARSNFVLDGNSFSVTPDGADPLVSATEKQRRLHQHLHHYQRDPLGVGDVASSLPPTALFPSTSTASSHTPTNESPCQNQRAQSDPAALSSLFASQHL